MPELPEVETIRRDLAAVLSGQTISAIHIFSPKTVQPSAAFFKKSLVGRRVAKVERRGKLLIFALADSGRLSVQSTKSQLAQTVKSKTESKFLLIHLKMTGQLIYRDGKQEIVGGHSANAASFPEAVGGELPNKHTRVIIDFASGSRLFFNDLRKFGYLKIVDRTELEKILKNNYGPEPLTSEFSLAVFQAALKNKKTKIKVFLLDQKRIAGLGNIYVDESLFAAKIRPERLAGSLKAAESKKLWQAINQVIKLAIKHRGTTFNNYRDSSGRKGNYSRFLQVYGRRGEACPVCGRPLTRIKVAGRGTHYCPHCQK